MKLISTTLFTLLLAVAGCGKQEPAPVAVPKAPPQQTMPALQSGADTAAAPAQGTAPALPAATDLATVQRPINEKGDPMSDVEMLNQILANYREAQATLTPVQSRTYKTEAEQMAAEAAQQKANEARANVKDLTELVKAGVIKALPTPPAGKKFAIDPQSHKVVLVNAP